MPNQFRSPLAAILVAVLALAGLVPLTVPHAAAQNDAPLPAYSAIDLATVPLSPDDLPESGFQLVQAGDMELSALQYAWSGDGLEPDQWRPIKDHFTQSYSMVLDLLSDRADASSEPIAHLLTTVVVLDSARSVAQARDAALDVFAIEEDDTGEIDGVVTYEDQQGIIGLGVVDDALIVIQYSFSAQQFSTRQNTEAWTPETIATLVGETGSRFQDAADNTGSGADSLGIANVMFSGPDAGWSISWPFFPNTEHYRVRDGEVLAYAGELERDARKDIPDGVEDLFVSRQQVGDDEYSHMIDVTLARFETEDEAAAFAGNPAPIGFPPNWEFEVAYSNAEDLGDGVRLERARADSDALRATGYRTVRQEGTVVQVVQWLASEKARASEEGMAQVTAWQSDCLDALPEPCAPISQDAFPAALDAETARDQDGQDGEATPGLSGENVLASTQYGWSILLPDDGWSITTIEMDTGIEYYQLQSGRSLMEVESAPDRHGDPQRCVLDNLALLEQLEERAVITLGSDDPDERPAGLEQFHGWAVYTVEPLQEERADQEYTIRIDCYTLIPGEASLVVTHTAPRDLWTEEREKGERFRDAIRLPKPSQISSITPLEGDERPMGRTLTMGIPRIWMNRAA